MVTATARGGAGDRRPSPAVLLWSAGEASGDRHAAGVVRAIHALRPDVRSIGLGGPAMAAAGVELVAGMDEVAVVGLTEVVGRWRELLRVRRRLLDRLAGGNRSAPPALFIPVDFPGLNLRLAGRARRLGVPVVYFISPQLWAWGRGRMAGIRANVQRMLVLFDFEERLYVDAGVPVTLVGHPLVEQVAEVPARDAARARLGLAEEERALVLMPGSRAGETRTMAPPMLAVARRLRSDLPDLRVFVRLAPGLAAAPVAEAARRAEVEVEIVTDGDPEVVRAADLALVAAGTATLETALLETPMLILYRVSWLTYMIARRLVSIPWIGLVNLVAGREVVPEFVQERLEIEEVARSAERLLVDPAARAAQLADLREVGGRLGGPGAAARAAAAVLSELDRVTGPPNGAHG
jgi:lipid-A-disaccharide synthase